MSKTKAFLAEVAIDQTIYKYWQFGFQYQKRTGTNQIYVVQYIRHLAFNVQNARLAFHPSITLWIHGNQHSFCKSLKFQTKCQNDVDLDFGSQQRPGARDPGWPCVDRQFGIRMQRINGNAMGLCLWIFYELSMSHQTMYLFIHQCLHVLC